MSYALRAPAVPLVTIDPYFSVWSFADHLYDDFTRHWTGRRNAFTGIITVDGEPLMFAGKAEPDPEKYFPEPHKMKQTGCDISPLTTKYTFSGRGIELNVSFTSPLLPDEPDILSRPVSYVSFTAHAVDRKAHDVKIYVDVSGEWCVNTSEEKVTGGRRTLKNGIHVMYLGSESQKVLGHQGDDIRINWGWMNMAVFSPGTAQNSTAAQTPGATHTFIGTAAERKKFILSGKVSEKDFSDFPVAVREVQPIMASITSLGMVGNEGHSFCIALAYDDIKSIEYFGSQLNAYWRRNGTSFDDMLVQAIEEYDSIIKRCAAFDEKLMQEAEAAGGKKYGELVSLAYRQAIAAHKLVCDNNGDILFISKECFSNGCAATVDVSYPSIPLFLLYNTEFAKGMLRPIFRYASSDAWKFDFAPHDAGCYPKVNGQVYGDNKLEYQMPVEECGNMLIMTTAICIAEKNAGFSRKHWGLIEKWGNYLVIHGLDPENQLCTDDFAGHLAHNCNLSVKAIMGVACYAILCGMLNKKDDASKFMDIARKMAAEWEKKAFDGDHYKLAFDQEGTWSLKYNLVWDRILNTRIFSDEVYEKEIAYYLKKKNKYGIPLDSRETYTKADWLVWVASMAGPGEAFDEIIDMIWDYANETLSRVPFSDWYDTVGGHQIGFQHRSVIGGIFIKILADRNTLALE